MPMVIMFSELTWWATLLQPRYSVFSETRRLEIGLRWPFWELAMSPTILSRQQRGEGRAAKHYVWSRAGSMTSSGTHLYHLQAARQELIDASAALGRPKQSLLLLGGDATEAKFKSEPLSNFKVIHFAVHGISAPHFPHRSALVLGRDPLSKDDGLLQFREIAQLPLSADLVTLSACDTANGELQGEEGSTGLVQACRGEKRGGLSMECR